MKKYFFQNTPIPLLAQIPLQSLKILEHLD
jgi:hypothetical protein